MSVEEFVLESSFPSFHSLHDTLTGKRLSLHFAEPVVLEIADFMNLEPNSGPGVAVLSYHLFSLLLLEQSLNGGKEIRAQCIVCC